MIEGKWIKNHYYSYLFYSLVLNFLTWPIFHSKSHFLLDFPGFQHYCFVAYIWLLSNPYKYNYPPSEIVHLIGMPFILQLLELMFEWLYPNSLWSLTLYYVGCWIDSLSWLGHFQWIRFSSCILCFSTILCPISPALASFHLVQFWLSSMVTQVEEEL